MRARLPVSAAVVVGWALAAQAVPGCSPPATTTPDGGTLGEPCTGGSGTVLVQGGCHTGFDCYSSPNAPSGYCLKLCNSNDDCGTGGVCQGAATGLQGQCYLACDTPATTTTDANAFHCAFPDLVCNDVGSTTGVCIENCNDPGYDCGTIVDDNDNPIELTCDIFIGECVPSGNVAAFGSCAPPTSGTAAPPECAPGLNALGNTDTGSDCVCYPDCSGSATCPSGTLCHPGYWSQNGLSRGACLPDCTSGQACAVSGWKCQSLSSTQMVCEPPAN